MRTSARSTLFVTLAAVIALSMLISCSTDKKEAEGPQKYALKGVVEKVEKEDGYMSVAHESIPNFMEAMTMSFMVKDTTAFDRVQVGDSIAATLVVDDTRMWLESVQLAGAADTTQTTQ